MRKINVRVCKCNGGKEGEYLFRRQGHQPVLFFADGSKKSLGIMLPGEYEFNTGDAEIMEILSGDLEVQLAGESWKRVEGGSNFSVPAKSSFKLKIKTLTDYCCSFVK